MIKKNYVQRVELLAAAFNDYRVGAYFFVAEAVSSTIAELTKGDKVKPRHVSGRELLEGFRTLALEQFGPLALDVLYDWNIRSCEDVGVIVFRMVEVKLLGANESDSPDDFRDGFDFRQAFLSPFSFPE